MEPYEFREMLLTPNEGARPGRKNDPIAVVIHWTANTNRGADAVANRNYFNNWRNHPQHLASAHYIVDDQLVIQCVPENEAAYHVGANAYKDKAKAVFLGNPNYKTIGIEICVNSDGDFSKAYRNTVLLTANILRRYGWGTDRLWRHYDITGKNCPAFFVKDVTARVYGFQGADAGWDKFTWDVTMELRKRVGEALGMFKDIMYHWAKGPIERVAKEGLLKGDDKGCFNPDNGLTRAEFAVVLDRLLTLIGR